MFKVGPGWWKHQLIFSSFMCLVGHSTLNMEQYLGSALFCLICLLALLQPCHRLHCILETLDFDCKMKNLFELKSTS